MHFINNHNNRRQISFYLFRVIPKIFYFIIKFCQSCASKGLSTFVFVASIFVSINVLPNFETRWRAPNKIFNLSYACITLSIFINEKMEILWQWYYDYKYYLEFITLGDIWVRETFVIRDIMCLLFDSVALISTPK